MASGMQTIGLVGGMSWESSAVYYQDLNLGVQKRLGGLLVAQAGDGSVDFAEVTALEDAERWDEVAALLAEAARGVERGRRRLPAALHDDVPPGRRPGRRRRSTSRCCTSPTWSPRPARRPGSTTVGFIGTTVAMSDGFFTDRIASHGLEVLVPPAADHDWLNPVIYDELVHGKVLDRSRRRVVGLIDELWDAGAGGVILGCTELELLVHQADCRPPGLPVHHAARRGRAGPRAGA